MSGGLGAGPHGGPPRTVCLGKYAVRAEEGLAWGRAPADMAGLRTGSFGAGADPPIAGAGPAGTGSVAG
jgi:hypothetical protein